MAELTFLLEQRQGKANETDNRHNWALRGMMQVRHAISVDYMDAAPAPIS